MKRSELISIRDTVQSIWVAIVLAFVLRAFVLEAFVIPTGSMAPQLMGQHMRLQCPQCGYRFPRGFDTNLGGNTHGAQCPNCAELLAARPVSGRTRPGPREAPLQGGDRVLVLKVPRQLRPLQRWDVTVFKDPQNNTQNYIKRLVGLPGEVLRIVHGDVFTHTLTDHNGDGVLDAADVDGPLTELTDWTIARKPPRTQEQMWQILFDNDYRPDLDARRSRPWRPLWTRADADADGWNLDVLHKRVFEFAGDEPESIRFADRLRSVFRAVNAYNGKPRESPFDQTCTDVKLETTIKRLDGAPTVLLTLSNFDHEFAGEIGAGGHVRLLHRRLDDFGRPTKPWSQADVWAAGYVAGLDGDRPAAVALAHADWRVSLSVAGEVVLASSDEQYSPPADLPARSARREEVDAPRVGVTGEGGRFQLWHTRVFRDVFYTQAELVYRSRVSGRGAGDDWAPEEQYAKTYFQDDTHGPAAIHREPGWGTMANPIALRKFEHRDELDEFFMLGDNSPDSLDSRRWVEASPTLRLFDAEGNPQYRLGTVPRYNLIGKAFFVYWPAGGRLPVIHLPIVPNVGKMRRIE